MARNLQRYMALDADYSIEPDDAPLGDSTRSFVGSDHVGMHHASSGTRASVRYTVARETENNSARSPME